MAPEQTATAITVRHAPQRQRYELVGPDDRVVGLTEYRPFDGTVGTGGPRRVFFHTEVDPAFDGQGLASRLVSAALDDTVAGGLRVVAVCPYVSAFLRRHHEWDAHVDPVRPEHLAVVP